MRCENCEDALPLLYDLADDEIDRDGAVALAEHLAGCPSCSQQLVEIRGGEALYRRTLGAVVPTRTARELSDAVWAEGSLPVRLSADRAPFAFALGSAAAAALALLGTADAWIPKIGAWASTARGALTAPALEIASAPAGALDRLRGLGAGMAASLAGATGLAVGALAAIALVQVLGSAWLLGPRRPAISRGETS